MLFSRMLPERHQCIRQTFLDSSLAPTWASTASNESRDKTVVGERSAVMGRLVVPSTSSTNPKPNGLGCISSWLGLGLQLCCTAFNPGDLSDRDSNMERDKL